MEDKKSIKTQTVQVKIYILKSEGSQINENRKQALLEMIPLGVHRTFLGIISHTQ